MALSSLSLLMVITLETFTDSTGVVNGRAYLLVVKP